MAEKHVKRFAETEEALLCCDNLGEMNHHLNGPVVPFIKFEWFV